MGAMDGGPCLHYDCTNRNSFGYCRTTACINEHYSREWMESTLSKSTSADAKPFGNGLDVCPVCGKPSTIGKPMTNYSRIISKTPEELAEFLYVKTCEDGYPQFGTTQDWLGWLRQEVSE